MVRHDTMFHLVSTYQLSWILRRHRKTQTATCSPFFVPGGDRTLLTITGLVIRSFEDAVSRMNGDSGSQWRDIYSGRKTPPKSKSKRKRKAKDNQPGEDGGPDNGGGGDGGGFQGSGNNDEDGHADKKRKQGDGVPSDAASGDIQLTHVHLGFRSQGFWSDGFSILQRVPDTTTAPSHDIGQAISSADQTANSQYVPDFTTHRRTSMDSIHNDASTSTSQSSVMSRSTMISAKTSFSDSTVNSTHFITPPKEDLPSWLFQIVTKSTFPSQTSRCWLHISLSQSNYLTDWLHLFRHTSGADIRYKGGCHIGPRASQWSGWNCLGG
ncbi:hypothetical protein B0H10DRAFT_775510 [Mycena sp. CBHHK59/15]|nr:hypothetical protein B0H10DRAFT_775510 [Mycena sp. CBHHK59/15]